MTIRGVLFDFSGTLFRLEMGESWLPGHAGAARAQELMQVMTAPTGPATLLPVHLTEEWHRRDLDPEVHRRVYTESLRQAGLTDPGVAELGYDGMLDPASWAVYPDVRAALERLRDKGIPVAVVSNIAWDIRPIFEGVGLADLVTEYVLSFQEGAVKPDEKLFRIACDRLGVEPADALMIGDSAEADGGAAALGCAVEIIPALPTTGRPDALLAALARHGL
ncbi:MAG TPA: HAD-IA family hydrolase [Pseudonocardiaceae bacterium]|nr:HAD-IA family hydrolase [Pseudonocardiaceae bacterium]